MLYDPKWENDRQLGPVSLKAFIAWLETMPSEEDYWYGDPETCALGQFRESQGFTGERRKVDLGLPGMMTDWQIALDEIVLPSPCTFGAALERARAALAAGR